MGELYARLSGSQDKKRDCPPARAALGGRTVIRVTDRELDVVLVGATGFVGRLTAVHLARHAPGNARIGLAARSADRLARVRDELGVDWPTVILDTSDEGAVHDLAARARVVATAVGPFLR